MPAAIAENFKGCDVIIRDPDSLETILTTKALDYNRERKLITVEDKNHVLFRLDRVNVVVLSEGLAHQFKGSTRKLTPGERIDIALFDARTTPIRAQERFDYGSEAWVDKIIEARTPVRRRVPFKVYLVNISSGGALLETMYVDLAVGELIDLRFTLADRELHATAQVLREEKYGGYTTRYGCKFLRVE